MKEVKKQGIESLFIPYKQALALKELGFDEPCMGVYYGDEDDIQFVLDVRETQYYAQKGYKDGVLAPTFSQVFRWFREKYDLYAEIKVEDNVRLGEQKYYWSIFGVYKSLKENLWIRCIKDSNSEMYKTYEEAELTCLKKLIEIVKTFKIES